MGASIDRLEEMKGSGGSSGDNAGWAATTEDCMALSKLGREVLGGHGGMEADAAGISLTKELVEIGVDVEGMDCSCRRRCVNDVDGRALVLIALLALCGQPSVSFCRSCLGAALFSTSLWERLH